MYRRSAACAIHEPQPSRGPLPLSSQTARLTACFRAPSLLCSPPSGLARLASDAAGNQRLLLELCIKLQRRELVPLELVLLDYVPGKKQCAHRAWVDFAVRYCRGGLRLPVHNAAATLRTDSVGSSTHPPPAHRCHVPTMRSGSSAAS